MIYMCLYRGMCKDIQVGETTGHKGEGERVDEQTQTFFFWRWGVLHSWLDSGSREGGW
jgi:hypothetical protein